MAIDNNPTVCNEVIYLLRERQLNICPSITYGFWKEEIKLNNDLAVFDKNLQITRSVKTTLGILNSFLGLLREYYQGENDDILSNVRGVKLTDLSNNNDFLKSKSYPSADIIVDNAPFVNSIAVMEYQYIKEALSRIEYNFEVVKSGFKDISEWAQLDASGSPISTENRRTTTDLFGLTLSTGILTGVDAVWELINLGIEIERENFDIGLAKFYHESNNFCRYMYHDFDASLFACNAAVPSAGIGAVKCHVSIENNKLLSLGLVNDNVVVYGGVLRVEKTGRDVNYNVFTRLSRYVGLGLNFLANDFLELSLSNAIKKLCDTYDQCCHGILNRYWGSVAVLKSSAISYDSYSMLAKLTIESNSFNINETKAFYACSSNPSYENRCSIRLKEEKSSFGSINICSVNSAAKQPMWMGETLGSLSSISNAGCDSTSKYKSLEVSCSDFTGSTVDIRGITVSLIEALGMSGSGIVLPWGYEDDMGTMCV